jgi:SET domain-containing protein
MPRAILTRLSPIHGNGIFAARDLPVEHRVIEYRGRILTHKQTDRLYGDSLETGHTFLFTLNEKYVIDGNVGGNAARWINHSCIPNCQALLIEARDGDPKKDRVVIETLRPVKAGEELTYDYRITLEVRHTARLKKLWACRCGAANCTGTLLKDKRAAAKAVA